MLISSSSCVILVLLSSLFVESLLFCVSRCCDEDGVVEWSSAALAMGAVEKDGTINVVVSKYVKNFSLDIYD